MSDKRNRSNSNSLDTGAVRFVASDEPTEDQLIAFGLSVDAAKDAHGRIVDFYRTSVGTEESRAAFEKDPQPSLIASEFEPPTVIEAVLPCTKCHPDDIGEDIRSCAARVLRRALARVQQSDFERARFRRTPSRVVKGAASGATGIVLTVAMDAIETSRRLVRGERQ